MMTLFKSQGEGCREQNCKFCSEMRRRKESELRIGLINAAWREQLPLTW
jgi:hypothetical protein